MAKIISFLERIARREPFFVLFCDRPYCPIVGNNYDNWQEIAGVHLDLAPSMAFSLYERVDEMSQSEKIKNLAKDFIARAKKKESENIVFNGTGGKNLKLLTFIVEELIPRLYFWDAAGDSDPVEEARGKIAEKLDIDFGLTTVNLADESDEIKGIIEAAQNANRKRPPLVEKKYTPTALGLPPIQESVLGEIISNQPLYVNNGRVFQLVKANNKKSPVKFKLGANIFAIGNQVTTLEALVDELHTREEVQWASTVLEEMGEAMENIHQSLSKKGMLYPHIVRLSKKTEYDFGSCGFISNGEGYYVFVRLPKFAAQDSRNGDVYWPFEPFRVAIQVALSGGEPVSYGKNIVVEDVPTHPGLYNRETMGGFHEICILDRSEGNYSQSPQEMVRKLSDAVNAMEHPLSKESLEQHPGHIYFGDKVSDILRQKPLTKSAAIKAGYKIMDVLAK